MVISNWRCCNTLLRPLKAAKLSDGTLRYLLLIAALLSPRPPDLTILNEPEAGLHPDLLPPAGAAHRASRTTDADHRRLACGASRIGARTDPQARRIVLEKELGETLIQADERPS